MRTALALVAGVAVIVAFRSAPQDNANSRQVSDDSVRSAIDANNNAFMQHMLAGHGDSVAALYANDANVMPPNMAPMRGMDAIRAGMNGMLQMTKPTSFTLKSENVVVDGPMAIERGRYTWSEPGPNNTVVSDSGKYLVHWHKVGDRWVMKDDMWNSDNPPPPPAPARRR